MVSPDEEGKRSSLHPISPFLESEDDGKQFSVSHIVIPLVKERRREKKAQG